MSVPMVYPGSPHVRSTDPYTSHVAADRATVRARDTKRAVYAALEAAGGPVTADEVYDLARRLGHYCTPQRVRTVLAEEAGGPWEPVEGGVSVFGNPARLWRLL